MLPWLIYDSVITSGAVPNTSTELYSHQNTIYRPFSFLGGLFGVIFFAVNDCRSGGLVLSGRLFITRVDLGVGLDQGCVGVNEELRKSQD